MGGQKLSARGEERSEVFVAFNGEIAKASVKSVDLLPDPATGKVRLLVLKPSTTSDKVTFSFADPADSTTKVFDLKTPVVLIGASAVELLPASPAKLWLKNAGSEAVVVEILIGRDPAP
ncbi:hypothetical protein D7D94_04650 [Microbacterium oryzae]|uniref:Uncharacterized protein n=1 Tax=Microbacterium oryzae TaxID=743009 RepID=A0A6I6DQ59_9MICO|nr:hypothetical protein D7D94_04650 [Microbacterium oryzae]